jgi:hypothetical protein
MSELWFPCAWTPGDQSLIPALVLHDLALPLHPLFSDTTRVQPCVKVAHDRKGFHHRRLRHPRDKSYRNSFHRAFGSLCVATGSTARDHLILQAAAPCAPNASSSNQRRCPGGRATPRFRDRAGYLQDIREVSKCARVFGPRSFCL